MFDFDPYGRRVVRPRRSAGRSGYMGREWPARPEIEDREPPLMERQAVAAGPTTGGVTSNALPASKARELEARIDELEVALQAAAAEAEDYRARAASLQQEMSELRGRWQKRFADEAEQEKQRLLRSLLAVADHLELALQHDGQDEAALRAGVETTLRDFLHRLSLEGVYPLEALGQPFDPTRHEAVDVTRSSDSEPDIVTAVFQPGYGYKDTLLRPARVQVSA